jgi:hypothetical protein
MNVDAAPLHCFVPRLTAVQLPEWHAQSQRLNGLFMALVSLELLVPNSSEEAELIRLVA